MRHIDSFPFGPALNIERHRLDNGLDVLIVADPSAPVVSYQTWFSVGSRHERAGKTGIAHLFEHLMFNETENLPLGEYDRRLEEAGADNNAATFLDWTYYLINLPQAALPLAVELESERMSRLVLAEAQLESEREVVANERRETVEDDVDGSINELLFLTAFEEHSYRFPTIGLMNDIVGLSVADCRAFYRTHYAPNNAKLVVVGDVRRDELLRLIDTHYGPIPRATLAAEQVQHEPPQRAERRVQIDKPTETARLTVGYRSPAMAHPHHVPLTLLNEVLFGGRGSRVYRALVEDTEIASDADGFVGNFRDPSLWEIHVIGSDDVTPQALVTALDDVLEQIAEQPIDEDELQRAQNRLELSSLQDLETASGKAEAIGFSEVVLGEPAALLTRLDDYRATTVADLQRVAAEVLRPDQRTLIEITPTRSS